MSGKPKQAEKRVKQANYVNYKFNQGQEFVAAIKSQKPFAVYAHSVSGEHGETYSFTFVDQDRRVHWYMHDIDDWSSPVIGEEQMRNFRKEYGAYLAGGMITYKEKGSDLYRFHTCDDGDLLESRGFSAERTAMVWERTLEDALENIPDIDMPNILLQRMVRGGSGVLVDFTVRQDHYVLIYSKRRHLGRSIEERLASPRMVDVTPYAEWLETMRDH